MNALVYAALIAFVLFMSAGVIFMAMAVWEDNHYHRYGYRHPTANRFTQSVVSFAFAVVALQLIFTFHNG